MVVIFIIKTINSFHKKTMNDMHNNTCAQIPDTYSWVTDERSECSNNQQTRDVYCTKNGSYSADES